MFKETLAALAVVAAQTTFASAAQLNAGETIRGAYSFTTTGITDLEPVAFFLRLTANDPFGNGDAIGIRYLDSSLTPLSFTRFDAVGSGLDTTVGISFAITDFLPGTQPNVPLSGFVEIEALQGSFDVLSLNLSALEPLTAVGVLRQSLVSDFEAVGTSPTPVPLPGAFALFLAGLLALCRLRRGRTRGKHRRWTLGAPWSTV